MVAALVEQQQVGVVYGQFPQVLILRAMADWLKA